MFEYRQVCLAAVNLQRMEGEPSEQIAALNAVETTVEHNIILMQAVCVRTLRLDTQSLWYHEMRWQRKLRDGR